MNLTTISDRRDCLLFSPGETVVTRNASIKLEGCDMIDRVARHCSGDWGTVTHDIAKRNLATISSRNGRICSVHAVSGYVLDIVTFLEQRKTIVSVRSLDGLPT